MLFPALRFCVTAVFLILYLIVSAQAPVIQWQKCIGGTDLEGIWALVPTSEGGYIMTGSSNSSDGDLTGNNGQGDVWVVKTSAIGTIQWQRNFGGTRFDEGRDACETPDGGFIIASTTSSSDRDVTGNHGGKDIWLIKLTRTGIVQWMKCYGGTDDDWNPTIIKSSHGGYIVSSETKSVDGDITGSNRGYDAWVMKIDEAGSIEWQKCYGGARDEINTSIIQASDGGYLLVSSTTSSTGDVSCSPVNADVWIVKLSNTGNIEWKQCWGGNQPDAGLRIRQLTGGDFVITGQTFSTDLVGGNPGSGFVLRLSSTGNIINWFVYGGSDFDGLRDLEVTPDGGVVAIGSTESIDGDICTVKGINDYWVLKLDANLEIEWHKTIGGTGADFGTSIELTSDGGYVVAGHSSSNDGDVSGNHSTLLDGWLVKLGFPGILILPTINITASETTICPGKPVTFIATITDGGTAPVYQWKINGINTATNNDTVILNSLQDGDVVSCALKSNSPCVTNRNALSNNIQISVDPSLAPADFLPADTAICDYGNIELVPVGNFTSFLWNTNATTPTLFVTGPGTYWLQITAGIGCSGRDTIIVTTRECLKGFFLPTAFTPNGDGRNEILRPFIGGRILHYQLTIFNRWGQVVFRSIDPLQGWDGRFKGAAQNNEVFAWTCSYQLAGEPAKYEKGTVVIIR